MQFMYIHVNKCKGQNTTIRGLMGHFRNNNKIEREIASRNNPPTQFVRKWDGVAELNS